MRRTVPDANAIHEQRIERTGHHTRGMEQAGGHMTERQFFNSKRWERLRARVLRRDEYMDRVLYRYGKRVTGDTVHHIFPREYFPEYAFEPWNLITVSRATHNKLHDKDGHFLTADGLQLMERTARKNNILLTERDKLKVTPPGK